MSRKKKQYNIMVKEPYEERTLWGCSNPSVKDGSLCCDGDCSMCGYKTEEKYKVWK